jgi:hypothetical protein
MVGATVCATVGAAVGEPESVLPVPNTGLVASVFIALFDAVLI